MKDAQYIKSEFDCFVRIGMDVHARKRVRDLARFYLKNEQLFLVPPIIYFETRDEQGEITEMWHLETEKQQLLRLMDFLHRFSVNDVKMMESLMQE